MRKRYSKPEWFEKRTQIIREYRKERGLEGDIRLLQDRREQSRLEDWKEFQFCEYRRADGIVKEIELAEEELKVSESRLQAAIAAGQPADEIEWIQQQGVGNEQARRGTAKRESSRQVVFLRWIDEQLPIIASECAVSGNRSEIRNDHQSSSVSTHLGKRRRSTEDMTDCTTRPRKLSKSGDVKESRRQDETGNASDSPVSPPINNDTEESRLDVPRQSVRRPCSRGCKRLANSRRETIVPNLTATSRWFRESSASKDCQPVERRGRSPSDNHASQTSVPSQEESSIKPAKPSGGGRQHAKQRAVQTRKERLQGQAGSQVGTRVASHDSGRVLLRPAHSSRVSKTRVRESKARGGKVVQISAQDTQGCDAQPPPTQDESPGKNTAHRGRKSAVPGVRKKGSRMDKPVRRSPRLLQRPTIHYPK